MCDPSMLFAWFLFFLKWCQASPFCRRFWITIMTRPSLRRRKDSWLKDDKVISCFAPVVFSRDMLLSCPSLSMTFHSLVNKEQEKAFLGILPVFVSFRLDWHSMTKKWPSNRKRRLSSPVMAVHSQGNGYPFVCLHSFCLCHQPFVLCLVLT